MFQSGKFELRVNLLDHSCSYD